MPRWTTCVLILAALASASVACADQASITIYPGENWISVPLMPLNPDPGVLFDGIQIDEHLMRFNALTQSTVTYSSANSAAFGQVLLGDGYRLTTSLAAPVVVCYEGVPDGVPDSNGTMTDMWIALPGSIGDGEDAGGVHWVGTPFNHATPIGACMVTNGDSIWRLSEAVQLGWIDGLWASTDNATKAHLEAGLSRLSPDESSLLPGRVYQIITHRDHLALVVPANVAEPSTLLVVLCGVVVLATRIAYRQDFAPTPE